MTTLRMEKSALERTLDATLQSRLSALPHYNRYTRTETKTVSAEDPLYKKLVQSFLGSVTHHRGPNRGDPHCPTPKLAVARIERIHVPRLQEKYLVELQDIAGLCEQKVTRISPANATRVQSIEGLDLNEFLMYHGAPADLIDRLEKQGLDPRYAGEHFGKLFGAGLYLATNSSKSDIYTTPNANGERCIMLVRACLGEPQDTKVPMPDARKPGERPDGRGAYNSIVAKTQAEGGCVEHPEFVVFDKGQALPEYAIWYKHLSTCWCTHCVSREVRMMLICGDHRSALRWRGDTTALKIKEHAATKWGMPVERMDKVMHQGVDPTDESAFLIKCFPTDQTRVANMNICNYDIIRITLKPETTAPAQPSRQATRRTGTV